MKTRVALEMAGGVLTLLVVCFIALLLLIIITVTAVGLALEVPKLAMSLKFGIMGGFDVGTANLPWLWYIIGWTICLIGMFKAFLLVLKPFVNLSTYITGHWIEGQRT